MAKISNLEGPFHWYRYNHLGVAQCIWNSQSWLNFDVLSRAVDKPKFMDRPPDHQWWKTGLPKSFLACPKLIWLIFIWNSFFVINTNFACFPFNHVPSYRELGRPSVDFEGYVGSPDRVMDRIWRLGDRLSTALYCTICFTANGNYGHCASIIQQA